MVKLLSNFDTEAPTKNYAEEVQKFWFDKVLFLRRHRLYLILYTFIPAWTACLLIGIMIYSLIVVWQNKADWIIALHRSTQIVLSLFSIYLILLARSRYFNYKLDYTIITPDQISSYNQTGLFSRKIRTIEPEKIKTIDFSSKWIINSIFNFWSIAILLEWDEMSQWEIHLDFIENPVWVKEAIIRITQKEEL